MSDDSTDLTFKTRLIRVWAYLAANDFARGLAIGAGGVLLVALIIKAL